MKVQKSDLKKASITFKDEILLNENRLNNLMDLAKSNNFAQKKELRPLAWRVFLGTIPQDKSLEEWIDEIDRQRNEYKEKLEKYCSIKKLKNKDPLLINENNENDDILISQDKDMIDKSSSSNRIISKNKNKKYFSKYIIYLFQRKRRFTLWSRYE